MFNSSILGFPKNTGENFYLRGKEKEKPIYAVRVSHYFSPTPSGEHTVFLLLEFITSAYSIIR